MTSECNILLITSKEDITTDFIVQELAQQNAIFYRFNTDELGKSIFINFDIEQSIFALTDKRLERTIDLLKVKSVYFRRPELYVDKNDLTEGEANFVHSELAYTLEGLYQILQNAYWVNRIWDIRNAENKIYQLLLAREIGLQVPRSLITSIPGKAMNFHALTNGETIIKPIKSGLVEGRDEEGVIFTTKIHLEEANAERVNSCPVYLQELIQKRADVRVTVVGNKLFPAQIDSQSSEEAKVDWRRSREPLPHIVIELPQQIINKCLKLTERLGLNFGAIDFVLDKKGDFIFLEINPNGQWAWIERQLGYKIAKEITNLLIEKATT